MEPCNGTSTPSHPERPRTAVFTIVSKNYLHFARVLMRSLEATNPLWDRFVLLADTRDSATIDEGAGAFELCEARALPIPEPDKFFFRYTILELNTAVKPWFFRELFRRGFDRVVYLDPDIFVYAPLAHVEEALSEGALVVLVPHLTGRIADSARPSELEILQSGSYNLGFCAMATHPSLNALLDFWCDKSLRDFVVDPPRGLFTDQRWMDFVPGMFPDVHILRHDGYDVAYWNLPHRHLAVDERGPVRVNQVPLVFFHFSGIDPQRPGGFSKHQNRYTLKTVGPAGDLARSYCAAVRESGLEACRNLPYAFGFLRDGTPIPDVLRRLYRTTPEVESWAGDDPFSRSGADWCEPIDAGAPPLSRLMLAVYLARNDLRVRWPDVMAADRADYVQWFAESPEVATLISEAFVRLAREGITRVPQLASPGPQRRTATAPSRRAALVGGALRKAVVAAREGRLPLSPRRWQQLYRLHVAEESVRQANRAVGAVSPPKWPVARRVPELFSGFHAQNHNEREVGFAWLQPSATIALPEAASGARLVIRGQHLATEHRRSRGRGVVTVSAQVDGTPLADWTVASDGPFEWTAVLPDRAPLSQLALMATGSFVPSQTGTSTDGRDLVVQIASVTVGGHRLLDFSRHEAYQRVPGDRHRLGMTIVGYVSDGTGVSAAAHSSAAACRTAGVDVELLDARPLDPVGRGRHPVNLLHVNADQTPIVAKALGDDFFRGRYTIGRWAWELEEFPDQFSDAFQWVDEVWAMSRFVQDAIAERSPVPVIHMPLPVTVSPSQGLARSHFALGDDDFVLLMMYDALSIQERKNPLGALRAFRQAQRRRSQMKLVIRANHATSRPDDVEVVRREVAATEGAILLDQPLSRQQAQALQALCDVFVSLHRSEGFGLNIAEAMLLGKPVIVTGWSGNLDFTTPDNACLIDCDLVTLPQDYGPYRKGSRWAEPDVDQASEYMIRLAEDGAFRRDIAERGRASIASKFSLEAIGARYRRRLSSIRQFLPAS